MGIPSSFFIHANKNILTKENLKKIVQIKFYFNNNNINVCSELSRIEKYFFSVLCLA